MQVESEENLRFLKRVDTLRFRMNWTVREVCSKVGISPVMLHHIKHGKNSVTEKSWHKLERAEQNAVLGDIATAAEDAKRQGGSLEEQELALERNLHNRSVQRDTMCVADGPAADLAWKSRALAAEKKLAAIQKLLDEI